MNKIDTLAVNTLRINGVAAVNKANSGHPGIVLGAAPMIHTIFSRFLKFDAKNPKWIARDRFVLSAGHGSALLYAQLRLLNLISEEDLQNFRKLGSITPGHPESHLTPGVEVTTGPLGQGVAMAVGMALAEEHLRAKFPEISHYTYVICGDGDLQEGVCMEAMSFAGKQELSKLIILHDSNDIQLDTAVSKVNSDNLQMRMKAINWNYIKVENNDAEEIALAIQTAQKNDRPTFIEVKTIIGEGATKQGTSEVHGAPLGNDFETVKKHFNWSLGDFEVPIEVKNFYNEIAIKNANIYANWKASDELKKYLENSSKKISINVDLKQDDATRNSSGAIIKWLNTNVETWIGGSADLSGSTKVAGGDNEFNKQNRKGRNILFGVREFAMAAIGNGIAAHSVLKPFVSTFFVFSDYLKPAIRLASLMKLPTVFIFTHDSIFVGEDGPTHQPIEHIAMMRSIPGVTFYRPADEKEVLGAYEEALNSRKTSVIALTRQNIKTLKQTDKEKIKRGIYSLIDNKAKWTLVASGSEVANIVTLANELKVNAVSISNAKGDVWWDTNFAISIECGSTYGLAKFAKYNIGLDSFGESGEGNAVYKYFGLDLDSLREKINKIISKNS